MRAVRRLAAAALGLAVLLSLVAGLLLSRQAETDDGSADAPSGGTTRNRG